MRERVIRLLGRLRLFTPAPTEDILASAVLALAANTLLDRVRQGLCDPFTCDQMIAAAAVMGPRVAGSATLTSAMRGVVACSRYAGVVPLRVQEELEMTLGAFRRAHL